MDAAPVTARTRTLTHSRGRRSGFTLVELLVAMILLVACVLGLSAATARLSRTVGDSSLRSRAQAMADVQIARARSWPTYATLDLLQNASYNGTADGLTRSTLVTADTLSGHNVKRVRVIVESVNNAALQPSIVRTITVAAP